MNLSVRAATIVIAGILVVQFAASYSLGVVEVDRGTPQFSRIPERIGKWSIATESALEPEIVAYLRPDDYILRDYRTPGVAPVNVFAAYFKSLQNTYGPHSPRVCLPGSGWMIRSSAVVPLQIGQTVLPVNRYVLRKNAQTILVLYWYQNDRRAWAEEFQAKIYLLPDLLRYRRSDVSLVRVVSALLDDSIADNATELMKHPAIEFIRQLQPFIADRQLSIR